MALSALFSTLLYIILLTNKISGGSRARRAADQGLCSTNDGNYMKIFEIPENSADGTIIGNLGIEGYASPGSNKSINLELKNHGLADNNCGPQAKTCTNWLEIDLATQSLLLRVESNETLDRDGPDGVQTINVKLVCSIVLGENAGQAVEMAINVIVDDVNDNDPVFSPTNIQAKANEIFPVGSTLMRLSAHDEDKISEISYYLRESPGSEYFDIPFSHNGDIVLKKKLDYESLAPSATTLTLAVFAEDEGARSVFRNATTTISIEVEDGDDQPPVFQPCIEIGNSCTSPEYTARLSRNAGVGDTLTSIQPGPIFALDPDAGLTPPNYVRYTLHSLSGDTTTPEDYFTINENTGEVTVKGVLPPKSDYDEYVLYIKATQNNDEQMYGVTKLLIQIVDTVVDLHPPEFTHGDLHGFVDGNADADSEVVFVRNYDGTLLHLAATDEDYFMSSFVPNLKFVTVNLSSLFEVTGDGFLIYKRYTSAIDGGFPYTLRVRVTNPEAVSDQTSSSSTIQVTVESNSMYGECNILNCNSDKQGSGGQLVSVAGVAITGSLLIITIPALVVLLVFLRKYRNEKRHRGKRPLVISAPTLNDYNGLSYHNVYQASSSQDSSASSGVDKIHSRQASDPSSHDVTTSHHGTVSSTASRHKLSRHGKGKGSSNNNNGLHKNERRYIVNEEAPSIAPYDLFTNSGSMNETSSSSGRFSNLRDDKQENKFNVEESIRYNQLTFGEELRRSAETFSCRGSLHMADGSKWKCFIRTYSDAYPYKPYLSRDLSTMLEILNVRTCTHLNLVKFYGCCVNEGSLYAVSELVPSTSDLRTALYKSRTEDTSTVISSFSGSQLSRIALAIADGLCYLHARGITHGDVRASNILLTKQQVPKLRECCGRNLNRLRSKSLRWAAPEFVTKRSYTTGSDVWSFAIVIWEILTLGGLPYAAVKEKQMKPHLQSIKNEKSVLPLCRNAAKRLWTTLQNCWEIDPSGRPDMKEVHRRITRIQDAVTCITVARPPGYVFAPFEEAFED